MNYHLNIKEVGIDRVRFYGNQWSGWHAGNVLYLYSGGNWFESPTGYQLSWLRLLCSFFQSLQEIARIILWKKKPQTLPFKFLPTHLSAFSAIFGASPNCQSSILRSQNG